MIPWSTKLKKYSRIKESNWLRWMFCFKIRGSSRAFAGGSGCWNSRVIRLTSGIGSRTRRRKIPKVNRRTVASMRRRARLSHLWIARSLSCKIIRPSRPSCRKNRCLYQKLRFLCKSLTKSRLMRDLPFWTSSNKCRSKTSFRNKLIPLTMKTPTWCSHLDWLPLKTEHLSTICCSKTLFCHRKILRRFKN